MPKRCALGCDFNPKLTRHLFPHRRRNPDRFKVWVSIVGGELNCEDDYIRYSRMVICERHFTQEDKTRNNRLNFMAVPSLLLPAEKLSSKSIDKNDDSVENSAELPAHDHGYIQSEEINEDQIIGDVLHGFPNPTKFPERFKVWVKIAGGKLETPSDYEYFKKKRICDIHFIQKHKNRNSRLSTLAVPCLNLPGRPVEEVVTTPPVIAVPFPLKFVELRLVSSGRVEFRPSCDRELKTEIGCVVHNSTMSSDKCCVPGCYNGEGSSKALHKFPNPRKDIDRFNAWLYAVGGDVLKLENNHIFKYRRVCRQHFEEKYLCRFNRLSNNAVPTKNMPGTPFHRFPNPDKFPEQFKAWVKVLGGKIENSNFHVQYRHKRICGIHFRLKDNNRNSRLNALAVPSLHLPLWCKEPELTSELTSSESPPNVECSVEREEPIQPEWCMMCLGSDPRMYPIADTALRDVYERITNLPFQEQEHRPALACYVCYHQLQKVQSFIEQCVQAHGMLQKLQEGDQTLSEEMSNARSSWLTPGLGLGSCETVSCQVLRGGVPTPAGDPTDAGNSQNNKESLRNVKENHRDEKCDVISRPPTAKPRKRRKSLISEADRNIPKKYKQNNDNITEDTLQLNYRTGNMERIVVIAERVGESPTIRKRDKICKTGSEDIIRNNSVEIDKILVNPLRVEKSGARKTKLPR